METTSKYRPPPPPPLVAVDVAYPHYSALTCSPTSLKVVSLSLGVRSVP